MTEPQSQIKCGQYFLIVEGATYFGLFIRCHQAHDNLAFYCTHWTSKRRNSEHVCSRSKGTAVPLQAWSGPEGSRKLRFPDIYIYIYICVYR
jgi:hypothetical protein